MESFSKLDYCQYLLSSQVNYTLTNLAEHIETFSHDTINRYLRNVEITPSQLWDNVRHILKTSSNGYIIFDDTVIDKDHSQYIELVRRQYSGNAGGVIRGIGVVTCIYFNLENEQFYIIDYRIFDKDGDGKSKHDHVYDMLLGIIEHKKLPFKTILMDTWYATTKLMQTIDNFHKIYYCPVKKSRLVKENEEDKYQRLDSLEWGEEEYKTVKLKGFSKERRVRLFRIFVSTNNVEYVITNDYTQSEAVAVQKEYGKRCKIEEFHREVKQVTGIERCQCRKGRIQRNHITCLGAT